MHDVAPRCYRGIFSWRISVPGTMLYRECAGELRKFMEILDTYWIKVFYGMSGDGLRCQTSGGFNPFHSRWELRERWKYTRE